MDLPSAADSSGREEMWYIHIRKKVKMIRSIRVTSFSVCSQQSSVLHSYKLKHPPGSCVANIPTDAGVIKTILILRHTMGQPVILIELMTVHLTIHMATQCTRDRVQSGNSPGDCQSGGNSSLRLAISVAIRILPPSRGRCIINRKVISRGAHIALSLGNIIRSSRIHS